MKKSKSKNEKKSRYLRSIKSLIFLMFYLLKIHLFFYLRKNKFYWINLIIKMLEN